MSDVNYSELQALEYRVHDLEQTIKNLEQALREFSRRDDSDGTDAKDLAHTLWGAI